MSIRFGIITISDRSFRGEREDISGKVLEDLVKENLWEVTKTGLVPDEVAPIQELIRKWTDNREVDVILTNGGTGFAPRDVTPEATHSLIERFTPGIDEYIRARSLDFTQNAPLSRAISGIRKSTFILNLPGNPKAAREIFGLVVHLFPHAVNLLKDSPPDVIGH